MLNFAVSEGLGDGVSVTATGLNFVFRRPVTKVLLKNTSAGAVYVGMNGIIEGGTDSGGTGLTSDMIANRALTVTAVQAVSMGVKLAQNESITLEAPADSAQGRRGIFSVWMITATGTSTVIGGVVGI